MELILGARAQVADRRMDASTAARDLHVSNAGRTKLLLLVARPAEDRVCVGVDEAGSKYALSAVDDAGKWVGIAEGDLVIDGEDGSLVDEHRGARAHDGICHFVPTPRAPGTRAG